MKIPYLFFLTTLLFLFMTTNLGATDLPFTFEKGYIVVQGTIKKDVKVEFIIATGISTSVVNTGLAVQNKIPLAYTSDGPATGNNDKILTFATIPDVSIGQQKPLSIGMKLSELPEVKRKLGRDVFAILGMDFFSGKVFRIDFAKRTISFLEKPAIADYAAAAKVGGDANRRVFKMDLYEKKFDGRSEISMPVVEGITYNKKPIRTLLDTGSISAVNLSSSAGKEIGIAELPAARATKSGTVSILFLDKEIENVPMTLFGKDLGLDRSIKEYGAVIGVAVLQNFIMTIDGKEKYLVIEKP